MIRLFRIIAHLLAILIILASMYVIVQLIHYAIYGNPIHDAGHLIDDVRRAIK